MTRNLSSGQQTQAEQGTGVTVIHLLELTYYDDGTQTESKTRFTTADDDIDATIDGQLETFVGVGGFLGWDSVEETTDMKAQGLTLTLDGVNQVVISSILNNQFRGRPCRLWRCYFDPDTGTIVDSPLLLFEGRQMGDYEINENWGDEATHGGVSISTRVMSRLADLDQSTSVRTNTNSHNEMLERAGLSTGDTFFQNIPAINKKRIFWGTDKVDEGTDEAPNRSGDSFIPGAPGAPKGPGV